MPSTSRRVARPELVDEGKRVGALVLFDHPTVDLDGDAVTRRAQHGAARQADDRVAAPLLATSTDSRVRVRAGGELQVGAERGVEVGEDLADDRDAVVALGGQGGELFGVHGALHAEMTGNGGRNRVSGAIARPCCAHDAFERAHGDKW